MNVSLTPEMEQLVSDAIKTGLYQTPNEVIREGLRLLERQDRHLELLRRDVRAGFERAEVGEFTEYDEVNLKDLSNRIRDLGVKRLADDELKTAER